MIKYYNLKNKEYVTEEESAGLKFLYDNVFGRLILKIVISKPIRNIYNKFMSSGLSKGKIKKFIKKNSINMDEYVDEEYSSFNAFFMRRIKDDKRKIEDGLIAVADSKLSVYKIDDNSSFKIKNSIYTVNELLQENNDDYKGGYALVFRLCVDDYHHYVFPDKGVIKKSKHINGVLHTVQPIAFKRYKVFHENARVVTTLDCKNLGVVKYVEVGAMMIGKIVNEHVKEFNKGDEKGHFEFGGSTIVLLIEKDIVKINSDIIKNTENGIETIVKMGNSIS